MARKDQEGTRPPGEAPARPTHKVLYLLVKSPGKTYWMKYGAGFLNRDGSINIKLDLLPDQQFQLRDSDQERPQDE
jgi:hypothetical protein